MAEGVVRVVIERLSSLGRVDVEAKLTRNLGKELMEIRYEFEKIQPVLRDAEAKEEDDKRIKVWVKQVRDVAYKTEDVIDEFKLLLHHQHPTGQGTTSSILYRQLQSIPLSVKHARKQHQLALQSQEIKTKVKEIVSTRAKYNFRSEHRSTPSRVTARITRQPGPREDALFLDEADIVGINESKAELIQRLVNPKENSALRVVSVYGMSGLGKTTLVRKVFDSDEVVPHFPRRAWITASRTFDIEVLLQHLIMQLLNEEEKTMSATHLKEMNTTHLKEMLWNRLRGKTCFVVLDDICRLDAWHGFNDVFPDDISCDSRIMVTTHFIDLAYQCTYENGGFMFQIPHLTIEDSLKLFCKKVFASDDVNSCPPHLKEISEKFVNKCIGLPLAIVSIAGLLKMKEPSEREWGEVYENLDSLMGQNKPLYNSIFSMSYMDLPYQLKSCLLYLSIFPEDYAIPCSRLLRLWVAEGFVDRKAAIDTTLTKEDIARMYLDELISRSLVQVVELGLAGKVSACRVHNVIGEFILSKAREQNFVSHIDRQGMEDQIIGRRLSILDGENLNVLFQNQNSFSHLRSLIAFSSGSIIWSKLKVLRVLDLGDIDLDEFPSGIINLFRLRYLRLRGRIESIPSSIGLLTNLEILDMEECLGINRLPKDILKLNRLRYFVIRYSSWRSLVEIDSLTNLECLSEVQANEERSSKMLENLGKLTQMRKLAIRGLREGDGLQFWNSVEKMVHLSSLRVVSSNNGYENLYVKNQFCPPQHLQKLYMAGALEKRPGWFPELQNLIKLHLWKSALKDEDLLKILQALPRLVELILNAAFDGKELHFKVGGFQRLKTLELYDLMNLEMVKVDEGAMPSIQRLTFKFVDKLDRVPMGIEHLTTLKSIKTHGMPENFVQEIRKQVWKDGHSPIIM